MVGFESSMTHEESIEGSYFSRKGITSLKDVSTNTNLA
jgi:hypothetical protein